MGIKTIDRIGALEERLARFSALFLMSNKDDRK
jgi:hypothetical protein